MDLQKLFLNFFPIPLNSLGHISTTPDVVTLRGVVALGHMFKKDFLQILIF